MTKDDSRTYAAGICISKARSTDIKQKLKGSMCRVAIHSILLPGCETWSLHASNACLLQDFDHPRLRNAAEIGCSHGMSKV